MRNTSARVLLGAGAFSLSLAALTAGVATPALLKAPVVNSTSTVASGPAVRLEPATGEQMAGVFTQQRNVGSKVVDGEALGDGDVAVYDSYSASSFRADSNAGVTDLTKELYTQAFDRSSGKGRPAVEGDTADTTAHVFKFPFDTQKATYQVWDSQVRQAYPARFVRETSVRGLDVYEFVQDVPATDLGELPVVKAVPGKLVGEPQTPSVPANQWVENLGKTFLVEPVTGSLVGGSSNPHVWAQTADGRKVDLLKVDGAALTPETVATLVASTQDSRSKAQALQRAPWVLGGLGLFLLGLGGSLLRRRPAAHEGDVAPVDRPDVSGVLPAPRREAPVEADLRT